MCYARMHLAAYRASVDERGEGLFSRFVSPFSCSCLHEKGEIDNGKSSLIGSGSSSLGNAGNASRQLLR